MPIRAVPVRYVLALLMFLLSVLLYVDRICISVAKDAIADELGFTETRMGWIMSSFALGYALFQVPSGMLADRYGPRMVLTSVVCFWSLFTGLTAAAWNYVSMLAVRFLFGAGEAGAFPNMARAVFSWFPMAERGRVQGLNFSGSRIGAAFALPLIAWMTADLGWKATFVILAAVGFVWAVIFFAFFRDDPSDHSFIPPEERQYIETHRQRPEEGGGGDSLPLGAMLGSKNMWLAMAQYFCSNFTFFFCLSWLFPHIRQKYGLDTVEAGFYASAPLMFGAFGNWFSGWMVDAIYKAGHWERSRRAAAMLGFALAAFGLVASLYMESALGAVAFLSIAIFGADMTLSPSWSLCIDIGRRHAGAVSGCMNMAGNIGSFVTALAFPYMLEWTGEADAFFHAGAGLNVLAVFLWIMIRPNRTLEEY